MTLRILFLAFLSASFLSILISGIQGVLRLNELRSSFRNNQVQIQKVFHPALSTAIWAFDNQQAKSLAEGLLVNEGYSEIEIMADAMLLAGVSNSTKTQYRKEYPIFSPQDSEKVIGKITVGYDESFLTNTALGDLRDLLLSRFIEHLIMTWLIFILLNKFAIQYIKDISDYLKKPFTWQSQNKLQVSRVLKFCEGEDEIYTLENSINQMILKISAHQEQKDKLSAELDAAKLQERTIEISNGLIHNLANLLFIFKGYITKMNRIFESNIESVSAEDRDSYFKYKEGAERSYKANVDYMRTQQANAKQTSKLEIVSVNLVLNDIEILLNSDFRNSVNLLKSIEVDEVYVSRSQLMLVLLNLIKNAAESLKLNKVNDPTIWVESTKSSDKLIVRVRDNGLGIPIEFKEKIFSYGETTKSNGHGFGLFSSRELVRTWGGDLELINNSENNSSGAVFQILIPVKSPEV